MGHASAIESIAVDDRIEPADLSEQPEQPPVEPPFARLERVLSTAPILRRLDERTLGDLACCSIERPHERGRVLLPEATLLDPEPSVVLLTAGWCLAVRSMPDGSRTAVAVCRPGEVAGVERLTDRSPAPGLPAWVSAGDGASVRLPVDALREAIDGSSAARAELQLVLAEHVAWLEELLLERLLPATERLHRLLVRVAWRAGSPGVSGSVDVPLTQGELADLIGATRETVNRSLRRLATDGAVGLREGRVWLLHRSVP